MAHNSAEKNPNFGKRETIDSSSSWKTKRWVDRENSIVSVGSLSSRRDFADDTILGYDSGWSGKGWSGEIHTAPRIVPPAARSFLARTGRFPLLPGRGVSRRVGASVRGEIRRGKRSVRRPFPRRIRSRGLRSLLHGCRPGERGESRGGGRYPRPARPLLSGIPAGSVSRP